MARTIDLHAHVYPPEVAKSDRNWPAGDCPITIETLVASHAQAGIDACVVTNPLHYLKGLSDAAALEGIKRWHEYAAELQDRYRERVVCFAGTIPNGGDAFNAEFERAVNEYGLRGCFINSSHHGRYPDEDDAREFFELAVHLGVPVMIHAPHSSFGEECMNMYRLISSVGRPMDESLSIARLIVRGVLERLPALNLICAHVGGGICEILPRMDVAYELGDYANFLGSYSPLLISKKPSEYAKSLYFDTASYSVPVIELGIKTVGVERMMFGSDAPPLVPMLPKMVELVDGLPISEREKDAIRWENAARLLGLDRVTS